VSWWGPLAIIGGAVAGLGVGYLLLAAAGGTRTGRARTAGPRARGRTAFERTEKTNYPRLNPAAFVVLFLVVALIVGLSIGLSND
jgi:hypothetical protein